MSSQCRHEHLLWHVLMHCADRITAECHHDRRRRRDNDEYITVIETLMDDMDARGHTGEMTLRHIHHDA